jgi:hypothetical protein
MSPVVPGTQDVNADPASKLALVDVPGDVGGRVSPYGRLGLGLEAYNRVFFEACSDPALVYDPQAVRFLVVLGNARPHDENLGGTFSDCAPNTPPTDFGRDGIGGTLDDLTTLGTLNGLVTMCPPRSLGPLQPHSRGSPRTILRGKAIGPPGDDGPCSVAD